MNQTAIINKIKKTLILIICYILLFIKRIPITYISDDAVNVGNELIKLPLFKIIKTYYYGRSGKFLCDSLMYLTYKCPLILWKIIDPIIWILIIVLIVELFTKQKTYDYLLVSIFVLLFPYYYLDSAGYIASSYNYVYTFFSILIILYCLKRLLICISNIYIVLIILSIPYATNQEQSAVILLGSLVFYYIYCLKSKKYSKKIINVVYIPVFIYSLIWFLFFFFSPGHIGRINVTDSPFRIPGFASWTILRKLYHGFSTTFSVLIFEPKILVIVFLVLLGIAFYINNKKVIGFIPLIIIIIMNLLRENNYIFYYEYSCGMPDFCEMGSCNWILMVLISVLFITSVLYLLLKLNCLSTTKYLLILLLCFAVGSRLMMGFSSTLYGSSFRTFSYLYFKLIIVNILLFDLLFSSFQKN